MATIGPKYLMQQIAGKVILFERNFGYLPTDSERVLVEFDPAVPSDTWEAIKRISAHPDLSTDEKAEAHFWSGVFYGCAR